MTILIDLDVGHYPLSRIERISALQPIHKDQQLHHLRVTGEPGPFSLFPYQLDRLLITPTQLLPAEPRTSMLRLWLEDDVSVVGKTPVIGWALCVDGNVRPVTPQGVNDGQTDRDVTVFVEMPDGSVQATDCWGDVAFYNDLEAYRQGEGDRLLQKWRQPAPVETRWDFDA